MKCYVFLPIRVLWQLQQIAGPYMYLFVWLSIYVLNFGNQNSWTGETKQKRSFQSLNFIATKPEKNVWSLPTCKTWFLIFDVRDQDCWEVPETFKQYSASYFTAYLFLLEIQSFVFFFFSFLFFPGMNGMSLRLQQKEQALLLPWLAILQPIWLHFWRFWHSSMLSSLGLVPWLGTQSSVLRWEFNVPPCIAPLPCR